MQLLQISLVIKAMLFEQNWGASHSQRLSDGLGYVCWLAVQLEALGLRECWGEVETPGGGRQHQGDRGKADHSPVLWIMADCSMFPEPSLFATLKCGSQTQIKTMEGSGRDPALYMSQTNNQPCAQGVAHRMCLINNEGLSSGPVVKSACQSRGHRFDPWSRKIPCASEQAKPVHHNYWSLWALEPVLQN